MEIIIFHFIHIQSFFPSSERYHELYIEKVGTIIFVGGKIIIRREIPLVFEFQIRNVCYIDIDTARDSCQVILLRSYLVSLHIIQVVAEKKNKRDGIDILKVYTRRYLKPVKAYTYQFISAVVLSLQNEGAHLAFYVHGQQMFCACPGLVYVMDIGESDIKKGDAARLQ